MLGSMLMLLHRFCCATTNVSDEGVKYPFWLHQQYTATLLSEHNAHADALKILSI